MMDIRSAYNYDGDVVSHQTGLTCESPTMAQQHMRDECDINVLVARFARAGTMPEPPSSWPTPPDFDEIFDFQSAMNVIRAGKEAFDTLPSGVRSRFRNDPQEYLAFVNDPDNLFEAERLGLVPRGTFDASRAPVDDKKVDNTDDDGV